MLIIRLWFGISFPPEPFEPSASDQFLLCLHLNSGYIQLYPPCFRWIRSSWPPGKNLFRMTSRNRGRCRICGLVRRRANIPRVSSASFLLTSLFLTDHFRIDSISPLFTFYLRGPWTEHWKLALHILLCSREAGSTVFAARWHAISVSYGFRPVHGNHTTPSMPVTSHRHGSECIISSWSNCMSALPAQGILADDATYCLVSFPSLPRLNAFTKVLATLGIANSRAILLLSVANFRFQLGWKCVARPIYDIRLCIRLLDSSHDCLLRISLSMRGMKSPYLLYIEEKHVWEKRK